MTDRKLMQQALETLEWHLEKGAWGADIEGVTAALRERLAQPERQWQGLTDEELNDAILGLYATSSPDVEETKLALIKRLAQPERQWQGLTSTELHEVYIAVKGNEWCLGGISDADSFCKAVEAKLKEKNT